MFKPPCPEDSSCTHDGAVHSQCFSVLWNPPEFTQVDSLVVTHIPTFKVHIPRKVGRIKRQPLLPGALETRRGGGEIRKKGECGSPRNDTEGHGGVCGVVWEFTG